MIAIASFEMIARALLLFSGAYPQKPCATRTGSETAAICGTSVQVLVRPGLMNQPVSTAAG